MADCSAVSKVSDEEEEGMNAQDGACLMEALPEELILHIFQFLGPEDLMIRTPMVCKRWYRLSRDPCIWRHQELAYRMCQEDEFVLCVRRAPRLHKLDCSRLARLCPAEKHLDSIQCPVSQLVLGDDMDAEVAVRLVERCLTHLDTLVVGRISMNRQNYLDMMRAIDHSRLRVLVFSPRCRQQELTDEHEFVACSPEKRTLRHLELWSEDDMPVLAVCKLIRAHCESLRVLSHEYMRRRPMEAQEQRVMEAVATCLRIEELRVWSSHRLRQLDACESLRSLTLMCDGDCRLEDTDGAASSAEAADVGRACEEFFMKSAVLPRLRELSLRLHECGPGQVMRVIAERCPDLEVLAVRCSATDKNLNAYLEDLTRLHTLTLIGVHYMHPDMLSEWTEHTAPALRLLVLIGTLRFCPWVCWASPVKELRRRRPWLRVKLRECEHFHTRD